MVIALKAVAIVLLRENDMVEEYLLLYYYECFACDLDDTL